MSLAAAPVPAPRLPQTPLGRLLMLWRLLVRTFAQLWRFAAELLAAFLTRRKSKRKIQPWMLIRRSKNKALHPHEAKASEADIKRMLERMHDLDDAGRLSEKAVAFAGSGADFFADPREAEAIITALIRENPPFLHIACENPAPEEGESSHVETEYLLREAEVVVSEPYTLFIPQTGIEHLESKRPPGYPLLRSARTLSDLRTVPMLYQSLPEDLLIARLVEGTIPLLAYKEERRYLLFKQEERIVERRERRQTRVPIEIETGGEGEGTRLMYMLFDRSASMVHNCAPRGIHAVMELAIAIAMLRADMGHPHARYYFRAFADRLDPLPKDPPLTATTVKEKNWLVERLFNTNFSGDATRVVDALEVAVDDIEHIIESGELGANVKPRIGLLTDGRISVYGSIAARMKRLGIELDTVLIGKEAAHNPDLMRVSSTISVVDPTLYRGSAVV